MKVVHLSSVDFWEQGLLAYRIHKGVEKHGVDSVFITFLKSSGDPSVKVIIRDPVFKQKIKLVDNMTHNIPPLLADILSQWRNKLGMKLMECEGEVTFSLPDPDVDLGALEQVQDADIIHVHWTPGLLNLEIAPLFFLGKSVIFTIYDMSLFTGGCHYPFDCMGYLDGCLNCPEVLEEVQPLIASFWRIKKNIFDFINFKIVGQSTFLKDKVEDIGFKDVEVILPNTPFLEYKLISKSRARDILGIEQDKNVIISVVPSVASKRKNINTLIEAIHLLRDRREIVRPYVILIGADYIETDRKITFPLQHIPLVPNEEVLSWYYRASDLFVSTAYYDPVTIYPLDAMAMGVPVVGFSTTMLEDCIDHKINGYIARNKDITDLANGIKYILNEIKNNFSIQKKAREKIKKYFSWDQQTKKYVELYNKMIQKNGIPDIDRMIKLAESFFERGEKHVATRFFHKLYEINPKNPYILNNIGVIYWDGGKYTKAMSYFKSAYEMKPDDKDIKENYFKAKAVIDR